MNVFRQHRERTLAEEAARQSADTSARGEGSVEGNVYEKMYAQLAAHKTELKAIESIKAKCLRKGEILDDYLPYVDGILAADEPVQDDIVMTIFVWALDAGRFAIALNIAEWALSYDIAPPPDFKRSVASILAEEMAELVLADSENISDYVDPLETVLDMLSEKDMADPVRAKLLKATGYAKRENTPDEALLFLKDALDLDSKAGVKRDIETLERQLKASTDTKAKQTPVSPAAVLATETSGDDSNQDPLASSSEADAGLTDETQNERE